MTSHNGASAPKQGRERTKEEFRIFRNECRLSMANDKGLSGNAFKLGYLITEFADYENPEPFPGQEQLAELMGKDVRTIRTLTKELEARGHLIIVEVGGQLKGKNTIYRMVAAGRKLPADEASKNTSCRKFSAKTGGKKASKLAEENFRPRPTVETPIEGTPVASRSTDGSASPNAHQDRAEGTSSVSAGGHSAPTFSNEFVMFWRIYPAARRKHKAAAFAAFNAALDSGTSVETIMAGVRRWRDECANDKHQDDHMRRPMPERWLNGRRWEDGEFGVVVNLQPESIVVAQPSIGRPLAFDNAGGYTSPDGTVHFTECELVELEKAAYVLPFVRHHVRELAASRWAAEIAPRDRTEAVRDYIIRWHNRNLPKPSKVLEGAGEEHEDVELE